MNHYLSFWNRKYENGFSGSPFENRRIESGNYNYSTPGHRFDVSEHKRFSNKTRFARFEKLTQKAYKLYWNKK